MAERPVTFTPTSGPMAGQTIQGNLNDPNPFAAQSQAMVPYGQQPMMQGPTYSVTLPSGQVLSNLTEQQAMTLKNEAAMVQNQQSRNIDLRSGSSGTGVGILRTGVDAMQAVSKVLQRSDVREQRTIIISKIATMNQSIQKLRDAKLAATDPVLLAIIAMRDAMIEMVIGLDRTYSALLYEALGHGVAVADDFGLFKGLGSSGAGLAALGVGGGLLLGSALASEPTDLATQLQGVGI